MSDITNAELPQFSSVEEVATWAMECLVFLSPVAEIKTAENVSQPYVTRNIGIAADGQTIFYGTYIIPIDADFNVNSEKIWKKTKEIKEVTVPASFKSN